MARHGSAKRRAGLRRPGLGPALRPCRLAEPAPGLRRVTAILPDPTSEPWIVTRQDLDDSARSRGFLAVIGDAIAAGRRSFEGPAL
jgi:hypothetical protein